MNEKYYIKIQGKANIPKRLAIGHNYRLESDCSITSETTRDNEDGSYDIIFKVEPITVSIAKDNGEVVKAKDPRKNSVKFRKACWKVADYHQIDDEKFYDFATAKCIGMLESLAEEFKC